jgi:Tfp pilus assembly protein PilO
MTNGIWKLATALICVAVLALGVVLGIMPRLAEAGLANEQRIAAEGTNLAHEATLVFLKDENERIDEIQEELDLLRGALPDGPEYSAFVKQIAQYAANNNVLLTEASTGGSGSLAEAASLGIPAQGNTVVVGIPISVSVVGAYSDVIAFIGDLQQGARIFQLTTVIVDSNEDAGSVVGEYAASVVGLIFAFTEAPPAPVEPDPAAAEGGTPAP